MTASSPDPRRSGSAGATVHQGFRLRIDLTGSTTHPHGYHTVEVDGEWPDDWSSEHLREEAARWAGVPIEQVGEVLPADTRRVPA